MKNILELAISLVFISLNSWAGSAEHAPRPYIVAFIENPAAPMLGGEPKGCHTLDEVVALAVETENQRPILICKYIEPNDLKAIETLTAYAREEAKIEKQGPLIYRLIVSKKSESQITLKAFFEDRQDEFDLEKAGWDVETPLNRQSLNEMAWAVARLLDYADKNDSIKRYWTNLAFASRPDKEKTEKFSLSFDERQFVKTAVELSVMLSTAAIAYYVKNTVQVDWDFESKDMFSAKRLRFDDNAKIVNYGHAYAGMMYYSAARNNGYSSLKSMLFAFATSTIWEVVAEHREVVSINDEIMTPIGGSVIGEAVYQIRQLLMRNKADSRVARALSGILAPNSYVKSFFNHNPNHALQDVDFENRESSGYIDVISTLGLVKNSDGTSDQTVKFAVENEVVYPPMASIGKANNFSILNAKTSLSLSSMKSKMGKSEIEMDFATILAGYFQKDIHIDENERKRGYSLLLGVAQGLHYKDEQYKDQSVWYAIVHVVGASLDVAMYYKDFTVRLSSQVFGDFAMVKAISLENYRQNLANEGKDQNSGLTSVLSRHEYTYSRGYSTLNKIEVERGPVEIGLQVKKFSENGINGHQRFSPDNDIQITDHEGMSETKTWVAFVPKNMSRWRIGASIEQWRRNSTFASSATDVWGQGFEREKVKSIFFNYGYLKKY